MHVGDGGVTYDWRRVSSVIRGDAPFPIVRHEGLGDGLYSKANLSFGQLDRRHPSRILSAAIEAHFVRPILKRIYPAADKGPHEIITSEPVLLVLKNQLVEIVDLRDAGLWRVPPVVLGIGGMIDELGKSDQVLDRKSVV